ncbi:hypothetical protein KC909_01275, partial [Candidatus Dojkabacteria bacterium]|nr:hypothetical protein [Candidatus Dojkabacteria bacterium]
MKVDELINNRLSKVEEATKLVFNTPANVWHAVNTECLKTALKYSKKAPFYSKLDLPADQEIEDNPEASVLKFPKLA